MTSRGQAKVLDFGVAKITASEGPTQTSAQLMGSQTAAGVLIGSAPNLRGTNTLAD